MSCNRTRCTARDKSTKCPTKTKSGSPSQQQERIPTKTKTTAQQQRKTKGKQVSTTNDPCVNTEKINIANPIREKHCPKTSCTRGNTGSSTKLFAGTTSNPSFTQQRNRKHASTDINHPLRRASKEKINRPKTSQSSVNTVESTFIARNAIRHVSIEENECSKTSSQLNVTRTQDLTLHTRNTSSSTRTVDSPENSNSRYDTGKVNEKPHQVKCVHPPKSQSFEYNAVVPDINESSEIVLSSASLDGTFITQKLAENSNITELNSPTSAKIAWQENASLSCNKKIVNEEEVTGWSEHDLDYDDEFNMLLENETTKADLLNNNGGDSSDDYDTDIEDDFSEKEDKPYDSGGKKLYGEECKRHNIVPITSFKQQLFHEKLSLRYRGMGENSSQAISSALSNNCHVERCDLSNNNLGFIGGKHLVEILKENTFIANLDVSENELGSVIGCQLGRILMENTIIKRVILKGNKFTDSVAEVFAEVFKLNRTIQEIDLSYNEFNEKGALYLGAGLALNEGMEVLNLRWNCIRGKGGVAIANALSKNKSLKELDLSWNGLAFIGCIAIGRHLKKNIALEKINLSNNRIGRDGPIKLAPALTIHPTLSVFKIGLNPIGDEGVQILLKAAENNPNLRSLGFESITISKTTQRIIDRLHETMDVSIATGGLGGFTKGKPPPGNMETLIQFIQDNRMRLTDMFFRFDKDRNDKITKHEFVKGLLQSGLTMDKAQICNLIDQLDINNDGDIEFSEILYGKKTVINERRFQRKITRQTERMEADKIRLPRIHGF